MQHTCESIPRDDLIHVMPWLIDPTTGIMGYIHATEGRRGRDYSAGRSKAFEVLEECLARTGVEAIGERAKDVFMTCSSAFRRETSNGTKAAALKPMVILAGSGSRALDVASMKSQARMLRRDYERTMKNTKTIKGLILRVVGAIHTGLVLQGFQLVAEGDMDVTDVPTPSWLLTAATRILDATLDDEEDAKKEIVLMASALEALSASLEVSSSDDRTNHARIVRILLSVLSTQVEARQRKDLHKAALKLIASHADTLQNELMKKSAQLFTILLHLRLGNNKDLSQCAIEAYEKFLPAMSSAFKDETFCDRPTRGHLLKQILETVFETLDTPVFEELSSKSDDSLDSDPAPTHRLKTGCIRALGKLAEPAFLLLEGEFAEVNSYMSRLGKLTMYMKFKQGGNEYVERFESMERQVSLISAYADLLRVEEVVTEDTLLQTLAALIDWTWEHYAFEIGKRRPFVRDALVSLFIALSSKGCALQTLLTKIGSRLLALTLRVSSPDPIDKALYLAPPEPMWPRYIDLWIALLGDDLEIATDRGRFQAHNVQSAVASTTTSFVKELLYFCETLDLGIVAIGEQEDNDGKPEIDGVDTIAVAVSLGDKAAASNPGDMQTFLQLVQFAQEVIKRSPRASFLPWIYHLSTELMNIAGKHSSISGFYKLISVVIQVADQGGYFQNSSPDVEQVISLFRYFLRDVLHGTKQFSGELLAAVLRLLLTLPGEILAVEELIEPLLRALELGLQHPKVTDVALDTIENWLNDHHDEVLPHLSKISSQLCANLDSVARLNVIFSERDLESLTNDVKTKSTRRRQQDTKDTVADDKLQTQATCLRIVKILGMMGGAAHGLLSASSMISSRELNAPWDFESKVSVPMGLVRSSAKLKLDSLLPRTSQLALSSQDRATKIAACEALYGVTVYLVGKNAQAPVCDASDYTRTESRYRSIFSKLFPVIFDLAVDREPVARQMFHSLVFQMTRWYAKSQARELDLTLCLFDAIVEGLSNVAKGGDVRDLCASLTAELMKWSIKYVPGSSTSETVSCKYILRTLYGLMDHAAVAYRLGAVAALRRCLVELATHRALLDEHILEMLEVTLRSLSRSSEREVNSEPSSRGADAAMAILIRECLRVMKLNMSWMLNSDSKVAKSFETFVSRTLLEASVSADEFLRHEAQRSFQTVAGFSFIEVKTWLKSKSNIASSYVDTAVPSMRSAELNEKQLMKFIAVLQWSSWMIEMRYVDAEFFKASRITQFQAVGQYISTISNRVEPAFSTDDEALATQNVKQAHARLSQEILKLFKIVLKSSFSDIDKESILLHLIGTSDGAQVTMSKFISTAIFAPQNLGVDLSDDKGRRALASSGTRLIKTLSADQQSTISRQLMSSILNVMRVTISNEAFDLGAVSLESTQGCMDAKRLANGYWELASTMLLHEVVPREGNVTRNDLAQRIAIKLYELGQHTSPPQRAVGLLLLRICFHLHMSPEILMNLLFDRASRVEQTNLGESFYRNYQDDIIRVCRYQFENYADELLQVASTDVDSTSGVVASDIILRVLERSQRKMTAKGQNTVTIANLDTGSLLATLQKSIHHIHHLYDGHRDESSDVRNACHQRFLTIVRQSVLLHSNCESESNLFASSESCDVIVNGVLSCINIESMLWNSFIDAVVMIAEILERCKLPQPLQVKLQDALTNSLQEMMTNRRCTSSEIFMNRHPAIVQAFKEAFLICRLPSLLVALLPFCRDSKEEVLLQAIKSPEFTWNFELTQHLWNALQFKGQSVQVRLLGSSRILPALLFSSNDDEILSFFEANSESIMSSIPTCAGDEGLIHSLQSYAVLIEMYTKCDKASLAAGPCVQVPKLNAIVSKAVLTELSGKAAEPNLGNESYSLLRVQMAYTLFVSLLVLTQSNVKFYMKLFENASFYWSRLVDRTSTLEMEAKWSAARKEIIGTDQSSSKIVSSFTLSSTLAAMDSTLKTDAEISVSPKENDSNVQLDVPMDDFEAHPVANGLHILLKHVVTNGLTGENSDSAAATKVLEEISALLNSPELDGRIKLLIVKALCRTNMYFMELSKAENQSSDLTMTTLNVSPSFLVTHPHLIIDSLAALHEITKASATKFVSAPLREMSAIALECDALWTSSFEENKSTLLGIIELIVKNSPAEISYIMKENVKLVTRLMLRLRDAVEVATVSPERYFQAALYTLQEHLEWKDEKKEAGNRLTAIQIIGSLLINNVIDLQHDNFAFLVSSKGERLGDGVRINFANATLACLMRPGSNTGRKLNSVAAALLGKIMKSSGDKQHKWHMDLNDKLTAYYAKGSYDAFLDTLDRIAFSCPQYTHKSGFASKVRALLDKIFSEPKVIAMRLLTADDSVESTCATCDELLPFIPSLVKQKESKILTMLLGTLSRGLNMGLKSESKSLMLWRSAMCAIDSAVDMESIIEVREAHTRLCVAIAQVYPELANEAAVRDPLIRALADNATDNQCTVLNFWNLRLANENLVGRLRDVLCLIPSANSEGLWLAAACHLMLAVQEMNPAFMRPLIENDLSQCKFTPVSFNVTWRPGVTRTMMPLFATQAYEGVDDVSLQETQKQALSLLKIPIGIKAEDEDPIFAATLAEDFSPDKRLPSFARARPDKIRQPWQPEASTLKIGRAVQAAKQKQVEDFMIEQAKHGVKLTREYRTGDLPDVKISCRELLAPFLVTAERDTTLACSLLQELSQAARNESQFIIEDMSGGSQSHALAIVTQPLIEFTSTVAGKNSSLVQFILSLCEAIPEAEAPAQHIVRLAVNGNCLASGVIALEALIKAGHQSSQLWEALAQLSKSLGHDDSALLAFVNAFSESDTVEAIRQEIMGNLQDASKRYRSLLKSSLDRNAREKDLWNREYFRCAERLGDWEDLSEELTGASPDAPASESAEFNIPGEASGGSSLYTAVRVALRQPLTDDSFMENLVSDTERNQKILKNLGVEFALHALSKDGKDATEKFLSQVYKTFAETWSSTPSSAIAIRRKLIQSLQPAVEIDEMLKTIKCIETIRESRQRFDNSKANLEVDKLEKRWRKRWPSPLYDPSEVWERVVTFRSRLMGALVNIVPEIQTSSIVTLRTDMCLQAADGLREVGQVVLSQKFLRKYIEAIQQTQQTAAQSDWKVYDALFKLKILSGSGQALRKTLEMCRARLDEGAWKPNERISATILEARMCEQLAKAHDSGDAPDLAIAAVDRYMDAARESESIGDVAKMSQASLRLAHFCDTMLENLYFETESNTTSESANAVNKWLESSLDESASNMTEIFIRHALKALEISGSGEMSARHLIPRLLVLLRTEFSPGALRDFGSAILRVPSWLFLDWIPQLLSMLAEEASVQDVIAPLLQRLISMYPSAVRPHFDLININLDLNISERISFALTSSMHDGFNRAIELLDFPMNRLAWFRQQIQLREYEGNVSDVQRLVQRLLEDLAPTESNSFGAINARFAEVAGPILKQAIACDINGSRMHDALKQAEQRIGSVWNSKYAALESSSRIRLIDFSTWFNAFEPHDCAAILEIPGQYDNINAPPDIQKLVYITGFAPEAQVFASKQRPKKITFRGSDGRDYQFIAKGSEDLRQDERVQRLFRSMDRLLAQNPESRGRGLQMRTFHVSPLSERSGLIEFLGNSFPLLGLVNREAHLKESAFERHQQFIKEFAHGLGKRKRAEQDEVGPTEHADYLKAFGKPSKEDSIAILDELRNASGAKDALRNVIFASAGSAESFVMMRQAFASSLAASSICGYIAGVGDRHLDNILLDISTGSLIHIDFGYAFGTATTHLPIPELAPFRATPVLLDVLAPLNARTWFETDMTRTLRSLQQGSTLLKGVMDIFLRDPLFDWQREALSARAKTGAKEQGGHIQAKVARACGKLELDNPIHTLYEQCSINHANRTHWNDLTALITSNAKTPPRAKCRDVEEQVRTLIDLATNPEILAVAWTGWRPWL